jgi:UDP-2,4-diacetamido-2,4,6-trideoxy-beta-L-altropyranose hydrolase
MTLAKKLSEYGAEILFVCREHSGHLCDLISQRGFDVYRLPLMEEKLEHLPGHEGWLGASWEVDAEQTRKFIQSLGVIADLLVVDHYAVDHRWETALRANAKSILVIDDLADRLHDCDFLLDQNFFSNLVTRYQGKVPSECVTLLGPRFALLQPVYAKLHSRATPKYGPVRRILVFFGGADIENLTMTAVIAFQQLGRRDIHLDLVMTTNDTSRQTIEKEIDGWLNIHLHGLMPSLGPLMARADIAIGAGGATVWERFCLGLPSIVISIADNQKSVCEDLARADLIEYLGHVDQISLGTLCKALSQVVSLPAITDWSRDCLSVCDGKGANRVSEAIFTSLNFFKMSGLRDDQKIISG